MKTIVYVYVFAEDDEDNPDTSATLRGEFDLPFRPRPGDWLSFCGRDCCDPGFQVADDAFYDIPAGATVLSFTYPVRAPGFARGVAHFEGCGFTRRPAEGVG